MSKTVEPFSHTVPLDRLTPEGERFTLEADEEERRVLAERYDVQDISSLSAALRASRHGGLVRVEGRLDADLGRMCVVSLEPMRERVGEDFVAEFTTEAPTDVEGEFEADLDAPEPLEGDEIDLGAVALEQLVLAMAPHPRKEGAQPPADPGPGRESSPFDVLKGL